MTLRELNKSIVEKVKKSFYIFVGKDKAVIDIYLHKMEEVFELPLKIYDNYNSAKEEDENSLFSITNTISVIYNDLDFIKEEKEWLSANQPTDNIFILVYYETPPSKFLTNFKDRVIIFDDISESNIVDYLSSIIDLDINSIKVLVKRTHCNLTFAVNEIDKIKQYSEISGKSIQESFTTLLNEGLIGEDEEVSVFTTIDDILKKDFKYVFYEIEKVNPLSFLSIFYNQVRSALVVSISNGRIEDIENTTGLSSKIIYMFKRKTIRYTKKDLINILLKIGEVERAVKVGKIPQEISFQYLLAVI